MFSFCDVTKTTFNILVNRSIKNRPVEWESLRNEKGQSNTTNVLLYRCLKRKHWIVYIGRVSLIQVYWCYFYRCIVVVIAVSFGEVNCFNHSNSGRSVVFGDFRGFNNQGFADSLSYFMLVFVRISDVFNEIQILLLGNCLF